MYKRIDWNIRINNVRTQFGNQIEKILYSGSFNPDFLRSIESVYFECDLPERTGQYIDFKDRDPLNFPGPFYTSFTDNCDTGQQAAPHNILYDEEEENMFLCNHEV